MHRHTHTHTRCARQATVQGVAESDMSGHTYRDTGTHRLQSVGLCTHTDTHADSHTHRHTLLNVLSGFHCLEAARSASAHAPLEAPPTPGCRSTPPHSAWRPPLLLHVGPGPLSCVRLWTPPVSASCSCWAPPCTYSGPSPAPA